MIGHRAGFGIFVILKITPDRVFLSGGLPQACGCRSTYVAQRCISALLPSSFSLPFKPVVLPPQRISTQPPGTSHVACASRHPRYW